MHATKSRSSVGRGRFVQAAARLGLATALAAACSSPYEGGGRMPIPSSSDDGGADESGGPFGGLSPVDASESEDAVNQEPAADAGFDVFSLFGDPD